MKKIKITKVKELDDATVPNNILEGYSVTGFKVGEPVVGERFIVHRDDVIRRMFVTSKVTEIINSSTFRTLNSIYTFTEIDEKP